MSNEYKRFQEGLIRSMLARPDEIVNVIAQVQAKDFKDVNYRMVYESILDLHLEKQPISLSGIALKIGESGGAIDTGWLFTLKDDMGKWIQDGPPTTWAKLLKTESTRAEAKEVLREGLADIDRKDVNPLSAMDRAASNLSKVSLDATMDEAFDINEALDEFEEETKEILATGGKVASINSAYPTIDHYTQGWGATHFITVGARTGVGKSVFAINNAVSAMFQDKTVLFYSLEMTRREVISRMISSMAMIPIQQIEKAAPLTVEERERQNEAIDKIRDSKLKIDTNPNVTVEYIKRSAIRQAQSEEGLDFIIIDYLQLISNDSKRNRQEAIADVSRNLKILAKELNIPIMVLVQLNREKRDDEDSTPKIYDIRESGAIAQDSNVVILIDRKMDDDDEVIDPKATFIIAKNRQGESNKYISVRTRLDCSLFIDENEKGQRLVNDIETAQQLEQGGFSSYEDSGYNSQDNSGFDGMSSGENDMSGLFGEEDDFSGIPFGDEDDDMGFSNDWDEY